MTFLFKSISFFLYAVLLFTIFQTERKQHLSFLPFFAHAFFLASFSFAFLFNAISLHYDAIFFALLVFVNALLLSPHFKFAKYAFPQNAQNHFRSFSTALILFSFLIVLSFYLHFELYASLLYTISASFLIFSFSVIVQKYFFPEKKKLNAFQSIIKIFANLAWTLGAGYFEFPNFFVLSFGALTFALDVFYLALAFQKK